MLAQENYENVMGRQVAAVLSTVPSLLLPTDVVRLVVKHLLPDELRPAVPDWSDSVTIIVVSHMFHQWVWNSSRAPTPLSEVLMISRAQRLDEEALYQHIRRQCSHLVRSNLRIVDIIHNLRRSLFSP